LDSNLFTALYLIFFTATLYLRVLIRKKTLTAEKIPGKVEADWTSKYIFYGYFIILFGALTEYFIAPKTPNAAISLAGLILYISGIAGRQWAWKSLGKYWSVNIEIRENHEIIKKGPYKYIRHPNTLFHVFEMLGITLIPNSFYSLAVFILGYLPVWIYRTITEEKIMAREIGARYEEYKKTVGQI